MNSKTLAGAAAFVAVAFVNQSASAAGSHWRICNKTPEPLQVSVAYDPGNGQYVSKGYYKLAACGGCAGIGTFAVRGVWYRATTQNGTPRIEGDDLFCVHLTTRFQLGRPNAQGKCSVSTSPNSPLVVRGFRAVTLTGAAHTSNIVGGVNGRVCID